MSDEMKYKVIQMLLDNWAVCSNYDGDYLSGVMDCMYAISTMGGPAPEMQPVPREAIVE